MVPVAECFDNRQQREGTTFYLVPARACYPPSLYRLHPKLLSPAQTLSEHPHRSRGILPDMQRRVFVYALLITGASALGGLNLHAQEKPPAPSEVDQLLIALSDITWFNNIRPLNLTREQIDRLIKAHEKAYKQLEELIREEARELRNRKEEILRVREETSRGKSLPKEFQETIRRLEQESAQKRRQLRNQVITTIANELKPHFTEEQMDYMVKRSKEVLESARVDTSKLEKDQLYMFFVENVFLAERAPILLKEWQEKNLPKPSE